MFTAIVVDDDYPVLQYLSQAVKWKQLHIELLGTYSNGLEALEAIRMCERLPDIVITDIGMPKMNGLELIAEYSSITPDFAAIIISCHDEFHYAQKALKLNVQDYILKESLEVEQLEQILKKITHRLCSKQDQLAEFQHYKQLGKMNQTAVRNKFLKDTLYQNAWSKHAWIEKAGLNGINLQSKQYVTMILSVDRLNEMTRVHRLNDHTIIFAVENVLQEILSDKGNFVIFNYNSRDLVVLYLTDDPSVEQSYVYHMMQTCITNIKQYIKIHVSGFIGRTVSKPKEIQDALLPMLQELEHRFYSAESSVSTWSKQEFSKVDIYQEYAKYYSMISEHIAAKNQSGLVMTIHDWSNWVRSSRFHPDYVKEWVLQLLLDLHMKIKVTLHFQSEFSDEKLYLTISQIVTLSHLSEWFLDYLSRMAAKLSEITISTRPEVIKAQQYVIQHVSERITLEEMASYLNLNSSYFSRLFKRELNINFIEYVNRVKLQKAKELLLQSNKTVEEISDLLGYSNKSYFIKLFKRDVGTTPREFVSWDKSQRMMEESINFKLAGE
ncbi:helix-turn-helix domain-containing protein [Paenibacillus alvei]|uniref:Helix-turn-helix domain-containing protein n=1 Tax=Paenibacillus alvei TaxID=44250 RepID=A0ABT4H020_PAEAL|nr:helix-turn-helix domain-containing protein [Paenibacillus alvei]MCY9762332.1 helix-turn-helix domain-containing protein [Paenibacillus alvei]MCY9768704.1 helix-turn-helix domain-containing protein [Paenibacillus alvei]